MRILVFSDSHRDTDTMYEIIDKNKHCTDLVIHLGDNVDDITYHRHKYPTLAFIYVSGNCDMFGFSSEVPATYSMTLENRRIFMTHGHRYNVKSGNISGLEYEASRNHFDIVLYGHTHIACLTQKNGVYYFNPGSISRPRDSMGASYGIIDLTCDSVKFQTVYIDE